MAVTASAALKTTVHQKKNKNNDQRTKIHRFAVKNSRLLCGEKHLKVFKKYRYSQQYLHFFS